MGLVKTRRLAAMHPPSLKLPPSPRLRWTSRMTRKQQRAKAAVKPPMKGGAGKGGPQQFAAGTKDPIKAF